MQVIGFNLTKMAGEKLQPQVTAKPNTSIEFTNLEKEKIDLLKDAEAMKISFKHEIVYENPEKKEDKEGTVSFQGNITLSVSKDESKEISKAWKKKREEFFRKHNSYCSGFLACCG